MNNKSRKKGILIGNNQGSAMITALVVGVVVAGFCLSTLLVTYTLYAQTSRQTWQLRCRSIAQSFADNIELEFDDKESELYQDIVSQLWSEDADNPVAGDAPAGDPEPVTLTYTLTEPTEMEGMAVTMTLDCTVRSRKAKIIATIKCVRGDEHDRDAQSYTLTREFEVSRIQ